MRRNDLAMAGFALAVIGSMIVGTSHAVAGVLLQVARRLGGF